MLVAIVDYGSGNLRSAAKAFERAAAEHGISAEIAVTSRPETVAAADRIVLPGVGAFADCRRGLVAIPGLEPALHEAVMVRARPGFRDLRRHAVDGRARPRIRDRRRPRLASTARWLAIEPADRALKIPHMGWNQLEPLGGRIHCWPGSAPASTPILFTAIISG